MELILSGICKSYGTKPVLQDFSCRIPAASVCALMAPSGMGKTTLLRLILGLEKPDSGIISGVPKEKSALFQEDRLCPGLSAAANIRMAVPGCTEQEIRELLAELGLSDSVSVPISQLSGGMARRAALARALLAPGALLILDEPFTGLDDDTRRTAAGAIKKYRRNRTLLFVTHNREDLLLLSAEQCITLE